MITSPRQLEVAALLYDKGPLTARTLKAPGALLALMETRGLVAPIPTGTWQGATWMLTPKGRKEVRRCRKAR